MAPTPPVPSRTPACWPGLTQTALRIALDLPAAIPVDWAAIDAGFLALLGTARIAEPTVASGVRADHPAVALLRRVLTTAGVLLRVTRYPSFADGHVLSVTAIPSDPDTVRVQVLVPGLDRMPRRVLDEAYMAARTTALLAAREGLGAAGARFDELRTRFSDGVGRAIPGGGSTVPILKAAHTLGIPFLHLGHGLYLLGQGSAGRKLDRSAIDPDSVVGARISNDKAVTSTVLQLAGVPVPRNLRVRSAGEAAQAASALGFPVVVKPADRERGEGVEVGLRDVAEVEAAFERASGLSRNVLVEQWVPGTCHRILVADQTVVLVVRRNPKSVRGDGRQTVRELIAEANAKNDATPVHVRDTPFPSDALALDCLHEAGLSLDEVPEPERLVPLRPIETGVWGGSPDLVTESIHPDNAALAARTARLLGLRVLGLDIVTTDISVPWHANGARIIEANYAPQVLGMSDGPQAGIQKMLQVLLPGQGRIPVRAFVGDAAALDAALGWQQAQIAAGRRAWVTSRRQTLAPGGARPLPPEIDSLRERTVALMLDPEVDAIALVIEDDALLRTGMPVDRLEAVEVVNTRLTEEGGGTPAAGARVRALLGALRGLMVS